MNLMHISYEKGAFNRTIVELKYAWNRCQYKPVPAFNRTIVELKYPFNYFSDMFGFILLIVP